MAKWEQRGFAVVSMAGTLPLHHGFFLPEWEAERARDDAMKLPAEMREAMRIVPAVLHFELPDQTTGRQP